MTDEATADAEMAIVGDAAAQVLVLFVATVEGFVVLSSFAAVVVVDASSVDADVVVLVVNVAAGVEVAELTILAAAAHEEAAEMVEFVGASEAAAGVIETVDASEGNVGEAVVQVAAEIAWA